MSSLAKSALLGLYKYSGVMRAQERIAYWAGRRFMTILLFHRVTDEIPVDGLTVTTEWFRGFCQVMHDRYNVVSVGELCRILHARENPPQRTVAITFDDSYRDNLPAARVLAEHNLPATFFVPTRYIDTDHVFDWDVGLKKMPNLTWDDLREMQALGHEIGSHSVTHPDFGVIGADQARAELVESKSVLEEKLGRPVRYFAYPYGGRHNFRPEFFPLAREVGYEECFSAFGGWVHPHLGGQILPRESLAYFRSLLHMEAYLSGGLDWFYHAKRSVGLI